ncbi:MAG: anaerobic ribonucleoside-triphosphate reductase activating protein [Desulfomonilia bacterium]|jgi:pyruvate formate lyase activating enzyme
MKIGYVQKTSFIDYPGKISAVVFMQGCNFRCPYCHNPELVDPDRYCNIILMEDVYSYLEKRRGKLDAVVITGGEPTLQSGLIGFMHRVKSMGYLVKLDTNGSRPKVIQEALDKNLLDYLAMDIKAPWDKYSHVAGSLVNITHIKKSIAMIIESDIAYEFRTTLVNSLLGSGDVLKIAKMIKGSKRYVLQKFVSSKHLDRAYARKSSFSNDEMAALATEVGSFVGKCITR